MKNTFFFVVFILLLSCRQNSVTMTPEELKQEVTDTELAFAQMASDSGIAKAFRAYAAPDAVMKRGKNIVTGHDSVVAYIEKSYHSGESLTWVPEYVDVAVSGDLAYTYGKYSFTFADSAGVVQKQEGYFHTVWKRQPDGSWKFVWD
ncbi:MAG: nuclear transport factor 2 family protein [Bacteroidota bacterium]